MKLTYQVDANENEILTDVDGKHQVMMEWEKPYMEKCVHILKPTGKVLEIGFGLGYSASAILDTPDVEEYTVIDCAPTVWSKFEEFKSTHPRKDIMTIVHGRWQDVLETLGKYDTIFFDDYAYEFDPFRGETFLMDVLKNHTVLNARIGFYSTHETLHENVTGIRGECEEIAIDIPGHCKYAHGNHMFVPIVTKISDTHELVKSNKISIPVREPRNSIQIFDYVVDEYTDLSESDFLLDYLRLDKTKYSISFEMIQLTSKHRPRIQFGKNSEWTGIVCVNRTTPLKSCIKMHTTALGHGFSNELTSSLETHSDDFSQWPVVSKFGLLYRRLIFFKSDMYFSIHNAFGVDRKSSLNLIKFVVALK